MLHRCESQAQDSMHHKASACALAPAATCLATPACRSRHRPPTFLVLAPRVAEFLPGQTAEGGTLSQFTQLGHGVRCPSGPGDWHQARDRLASTGDDDLLTAFDTFQQRRKVGLCLEG